MPLPSTGYDSATISNPASALTDFTLLVDLSRMSTDWWAAVTSSDGTKGRAAKDDETELAADWIDFDDVGETGWLRVKWSGTLAASGSQVLRIYPPVTGNSSYAASDTYGSDNAYDSNWEGYWPDGAGTDRTANGRDATSFGDVSPGGVSGQVGNATDYDGTGDYADAGTTPVSGSENRTVICWANPDDTSFYGFVTLGDGTAGSNGERWTFRTASGKLRIEIQGSGYTSSLSVGTGTWKHCACVLNGTTLGDHTLYLDKSSESASGSSSVNTNASNTCQLGRLRSGNEGDGQLDEIQLHSVARASTWIDHEYDQSSDQTTFWGTWSWQSPSAAAVGRGLLHSTKLGRVQLVG